MQALQESSGQERRNLAENSCRDSRVPLTRGHWGFQQVVGYGLIAVPHRPDFEFQGVRIDFQRAILKLSEPIVFTHIS